MAKHHRQPKPGLVHHTDRGAPIASAEIRERLSALGATSCMSRNWNCHDNAFSERFFGTLKADFGERFENHHRAHNQLFDLIEIFYNGVRYHSALGYHSPRAFELLES
jgi:putative transposase